MMMISSNADTCCVWRRRRSPEGLAHAGIRSGDAGALHRFELLRTPVPLDGFVEIAAAGGESSPKPGNRTASVDATSLLNKVAASDWMRIAELVAAYRSLPLGTASVIATAERLGIRDIATLNRRHFTVVRSRVGDFTLLP